MDQKLTLAYIVANLKMLLGELHCRQAILRDYVRGVGRQYATGLYLFGRPGTAKTHTVLTVLDKEIRQIFTYQRGHLTPLGLFELIAKHPDEVIVLDDLSSIFKSDVALQVLLSALEPPKTPDRSRVVKYTRHKHEERVVFRGGIICISNKELHKGELLDAFKSRVNVLNYDPSDSQLGALMLGLAEAGWPAARPTLTHSECGEVARYLIGEMLRLDCRFDLRLFVDKALPTYQQWKDDETESHWKDLVTATIEEHLSGVREETEPAQSRAARKAREREILREIQAEFPTRAAQVRAWEERTGKSSRAFYRTLEAADSQ